MKHYNKVIMKRGWYLVSVLYKYINIFKKKQETERVLAREHRQRYVNEIDSIDYSLDNWRTVRQLSNDNEYLACFANKLAARLKTINPDNHWMIEDGLYNWLDKYKDLTDEEFIQGILHHKSRKEALR